MEEEELSSNEVEDLPSKAVTREQRLSQSIDFITTLTSLSHSVRVFTGRWQMIRAKLEELSNGLIAAGNCQNLEDNQPLAKLVLSISRTVGGCIDLAHRCIDVSYSGKLLMQSDLDSAHAKLVAHIESLSGVYAAGVQSNGFAIVVSRPGPGASRDDLRFYVKDLATRMKVGDAEMKRQALAALNGIVTEEDKYVKIVVESNEVVGLLAKFLDFSDDEIQYESARVLSVISGLDSYKGVLVVSGIIGPLIRLLEGGSRRAKGIAINCLMKLTENSENGWSVSAHGGVTALLKICFSEEEKSRGELIGPACMVLRNIMGVEEIRRFVVEDGAIPSFIKLVRAEDEPSQVNSIEFLQSLASAGEPIRQTIIRGGLLRSLVSVLDPRSSCSSGKSREAALKAVESLCFSWQSELNLVISYRFMDHLLHFLQRGEVSIQELAFKVAVRLSRSSEEIKKSMGELGFMSEFARFLEAKSPDVREMAAEALLGMVTVPKNRKKFVQEERNVGLVLQVIKEPKEGGGGGNNNSSRQLESLLVSTLLALSSCSVARRRIMSSGCVKNIQMLADSGDPDARKIIRKMSANRIQSIVRKILHK